MKPVRWTWAVMLAAVVGSVSAYAAPLILVEDGQARAAVWCYGDARKAVDDFVACMAQITGANLEVKTVQAGEKPSGGSAIVIGKMAFDVGLPAPPATKSGDGYRVLRKDNLLLMAGESDDSTFYATSHFLETLGYRWFFGNSIGTVVPKMQTVSVDKLDVAEKPDFLSRHMGGPNWRDEAWHKHNRCGGLPMSTSHDWGHVPPATYAQDHPEYYALRGDKRQPGGWLCTTNPDVQRIFAEAVAAEVKGKGVTSISISPPDGRGYCQCEKCKALDDPNYLEPSSGTVAITDRYMHFFKAIAEPVLKANPEAILNFYAYADYTRPPLHVKGAPPNLCAWVAPIRYCRLHSLLNPKCKARERLREELGMWQEAVSKIGYREYNYNLAEVTAPFSKISVYKDDIPYLYKSGCIGLNIECMYFWHIYGPHTYLIPRLAWDTDADVGAIMDDFYTKFCGKAAPNVKAYWERIDKAYQDADIHCGCFYSLHVIWTAELVKACQADLDAAAKAADDDLIRQRVAMFQMGLDNIKYYLAMRDATNRCDFAAAKDVHDKWLEHMDNINKSRIHFIAEYKQGYAPRFLSAAVNEGYARTTGENKLLVRLPDEWLFRYDPKDEGEGKGWHAEKTDPAGWQKVKTCSATLQEQGIEEVLTWMWYRTEFDVPAVPADTRAALWVAEVDGRPTKAFLNGELVGETMNSRKPFEMELTGKLRKGKNVLVLKVDHHNISELGLGGIIKPIIIYTGPGVPKVEKPKKAEQSPKGAKAAKAEKVTGTRK